MLFIKELLLFLSLIQMLVSLVKFLDRLFPHEALTNQRVFQVALSVLVPSQDSQAGLHLLLLTRLQPS